MTQKQGVIPIGSDHAGFRLKTHLITELSKKEFRFHDYGTTSEASVDYPDFVHPVAASVNDGQISRGIVICGSGQGANMTANKYPHVRSALCWDIEQTILARRHNDANILALPGRFIDFDLAVRMALAFLETAFEGGRHLQRIKKMIPDL
jgi:ribose 5-phosphate isomerase B